MGMKLFIDDVGPENDDISKIEINKEYARRFEHNKKREDLQRYEELKKKGHVRSRDPKLKEKDVKLFESDDDYESGKSDQEESEQGKRKDKKSMYLKDVVAKHLIEEGPDFDEQDASDDGDFLRVKEKKGKDDVGKEGLNHGEFSKKLEEYFGEDAEIDENSKFLKEFFKNKMWIDKERKGGDLEIDNDVVDEVLRDEEEIERQEGYEMEYNFRHEENAEDRVIGYSRKVEGTVRKKESKRKAQRERKEERMRVEEMERKEELKHLKNLKKEEIKERMKKVMEISGINKEDCPDSERIEKPDFDKEDELLGLPKGWDVLESHDGFLAARERNKNKFGLKPSELLALDEKELNQYVSLKKLAPYTDKEWKVPNSKRYQQKLRIKELLKEKQRHQKVSKKRSRDTAEQSKEDESTKLEDSESSKQGKKKRRQATNISESRRKAYGMISSNPKKNKHKH
ncbi:hypothetical protein GOBAR_DD31898 [Gossypium barbadense]|nr:hypothetical protein GOBAR_DD31898 [Gossypium barbadense]